ncbi:T0053329 isoform 1 [Pan troglodytes]|uniref:Gastrokine-3 n=1 Tax=Pan troglodytes TaxID=9598 RepID=A0A2J8N433_PANTR|nr:gastrokine-3 [Pan troglodytes]PNI66525.1 T0053329 isoform 1 [Pan troglodytes]
MKHLVASSILGVFVLTPSLAMMNIRFNHPLYGSFGTQIIHIGAFQGMVSIQDNNIFSEWDGILDYKNALLVAKVFNKMACVLARMDQAVFPSLDDISKALDKQAFKHYPTTRGLTYTVLPSRVKNLAQYGMPIKNMCRDDPTYFARQQKEGTALVIDSNSCFEIQLLSFMGLFICGEIPGL